MSRITEVIDHKYYPDFSRNWDDLIFRSRIISQLSQSDHILDLGAGAGIVEQMNFKGLCDLVCGVDLDPRVDSNPMLDEGRVSDAGDIPYPDEAFDLVFSDNVLEHLDEPAKVFSEVARVLKPGGTFLFKTPNKWHYMPLIARATPHSFHQFVNRLRGRETVDTFPTRYRANSKKDVTRLATEAGFEVNQIELIEGRPEYGRIAWPLYLCGMLYERIVNRFDSLTRFRVLLIASLRKPQSPSQL